MSAYGGGTCVCYNEFGGEKKVTIADIVRQIVEGDAYTYPAPKCIIIIYCAAASI